MANPEDTFRLALDHARRGQFQEAIAAYGQALPFMPDNPYLRNNRANALSALGRHAEALLDYEHAITLKPHHHFSHFGRGNELDALGRHEEALASYERAIALDPNYVAAYCNRGNVLESLERYEEAILSYEQGIARDPNVAMLHYNRGRVLALLNRYEEALASYDHALTLQPNYVSSHHNRSNVLYNLGQMEAAMLAIERAVALAPQHASSRFSQALLQLTLGDYANGFASYEWRLRGGAPVRPGGFTQARWYGEAITDKTILLHAEYGLGDTIQMLRYLPLVKARAAKVIVELPQTLHPLLGPLAEGLEVLAMDAALPHLDVHCPLMSLPLAFDTRLDGIPAQTPYLSAPRERSFKWQARLPRHAKPRVGLVWSTSRNPYLNAKARNMPLECLAPLLHVEGIAFVSLQKEYRDCDLPALARLPLERLDADLSDFGDTAAAIEQCDLVISVDTAVAHLAGALGKPVWVLLPFVADWRWLLERDDSPWYPSARLFRQRKMGDWDGLIAEVREALSTWHPDITERSIP
jgi:tetratricopeptide (TPR) repeat protein